MARVTSKRQLTIPKAIADRYGIQPGDDLAFVPAGDAVRLVLNADAANRLERQDRLDLFDAATARQRARESSRVLRDGGATPSGRGWTRADLYTRGRAD